MKEKWVKDAAYVQSKPTEQMTPQEKAIHKKLLAKKNSAIYQIRKAEKEAQQKRDEEKPLEDYIASGIRAGCPADQMRNFIKAGLALQPKQLEFNAKCRLCDNPDGPKSVMFSGGRGSAKSHAFMAQIVADDCIRQPNLKVLILRKSGKANREQINDFRTKMFSAIPHKYKEQQGIMTLEATGSQVIIGHFQNEKDVDLYLGLEYDLIGIEEANQLTFSKIKNIMSCLRTSKPNWRPRAYMTTNPGGVGHADNKRIYYDPWKNKCEVETRLVHGTVYDNQFVDKDYSKFLESLTGWKRHAWLYGSWEFYAGAFFSNFHTDIHVYPNPKANLITKNIVKWAASFDFGFSHNSAAVLACTDIKGDTFIVEEYLENEKVIDETIENIKGMLKRHNISTSDLSYFVAGKDCFHRNEYGKTIASAFDEHGITITPADVDRVNGWSRLHGQFGDIERGINPKLYIHSSCVKLIEQIQMCQHSEKRPGDVEKFNADSEGNGGDDLADALRYITASDPDVCMAFAQPIGVGRYQMIGG